ncbi:hypothetical protein K438DRAFT_1764075 [Mycena galopus ATCC 62051]|nr:hypothetical protein K438DRAFT_1764075 [Mycena galopus ATCC 62051]
MWIISEAWSIPHLAVVDSACIIDLAHIAKIKGLVSDTAGSLRTLAGIVLKQSLPELLMPDTTGELTNDHVTKLAQQADCVRQIYEQLMKLDSVGLPLQPAQICAGQLVTLVIGKAPLAEGKLVAHNGYWLSPTDNNTPIKITNAYCVIKLTKLLVPGHLVAKHSQTLQWLMDNGEHAIVQVRTLRSRSATQPHPSDIDLSLGNPAPMNLPSSEFSPEQLPPNPETASRDPNMDSFDTDSIYSNSHDDPDSLENDGPEISSEEVIIEALRHAREIISKDRDGLTIYRTVRGTNSVEGDVHMLIRRVFGSLRASPELTEAIIGNWFLRRNRKVGHYNRTGKKWLGHFDIWTLDDLVEKSLLLGVEPSIPTPRLLATRIATSESFGIIPIASSIAEEVSIPQLPALNLHAVPHHNDALSHSPTHLSTRPCNIYRYIQLRQHTPAPVVPVHTIAEYKFFNSNVVAFRNTSARDTSPEQVWKVTDYIGFSVFWNRQVMQQSPQILAADQRLYFKLPEQLLRHHKKTLQWKSSRATLYMGPNNDSLAPIQELLGNVNRGAIVLPAIPLEPEQIEFQIDGTVGVDLGSFDPMAIRRRIAGELRSDADFNTSINHDVPPPPSPLVTSFPEPEPEPEFPSQYDYPLESSRLAPYEQMVFATTSSLTVERPSKKQKTQGHIKRPRNPRRCARCATAKCPQAWDCKGRGGRDGCKCSSREHEIGDSRFYG